MITMEERIVELENALKDMVNQYAYNSDSKGDKVHTAGLSALEHAFRVLGLPEPCPRKLLE